ncbi:MAG: DUF885 domain-containing protein, partial [Verrucomicrobia bacterium]|nr:DUF885 domain-containing protein [Verrucomicrobiota bacterium]
MTTTARPFRHLGLALTLFVSASAHAASAPANPAFDRIVNDLADDWVRADPIAATGSQFFTGAEQDALDRRLNAKDFQYGTPLDFAERARRAEAARNGLAALKKFNPGELAPVQRVSQAMLTWKLQDTLRASELTDHRFVFEQFRGLQVGLVNFLSQTHPIRNPRDVENYLARLALVAPLLDLGITEATARAKQGIIPPKFILQSTLDGLDRFLAPEPEKNVLVASLDERATKVAALSAESRAASLAAATKIVRDEIRPAFQRVRALLAEHYKVATDDAGLWRLPRGAEAYAVALGTNTTTTLTPDQVHELGLQEVARIEGTMDGLLRQLGYTEGSVKARYEKLNADSQPPASPDPRPALLAKFEEYLRDAEQRAVSAFDLRPKAPVVVKREPPFTEKSAAAHYSAPAPDGTRPGVFWAPLPGPTFDVISMRTLVYHEGVPGHHFQVTLQQELPEIPKFRQRRSFGGMSAFAEGWALYTEQLAVELDWYEGDIKGRLGQLDKELFRARRLVVDTGLHAKKWTRQQAIDYGIPASEVERYVVMPGQACSYKIGQLKILEVRAKAQRELGAKFSLKEFHNVVLRTGEVPLAVLAQVVDDWIAT